MYMGILRAHVIGRVDIFQQNVLVWSRQGKIKFFSELCIQLISVMWDTNLKFHFVQVLIIQSKDVWRRAGVSLAMGGNWKVSPYPDMY